MSDLGRLGVEFSEHVLRVMSDEQESATDEGWRDLKVGAWFETEALPPQTPEAAWDIRAKDTTYFCDFAEAKEFGKLLWVTGIQRETLRAGELVFLGDGAEWIWNLVRERFPRAVQKEYASRPRRARRC